MIAAVSSSAAAVSPDDSVVFIYATHSDISPARTSLGTGFFISTTGRVATAYHVVAGASSIRMYDGHGRVYNAVNVFGFDAVSDVALLDAGASAPSYLDVEEYSPPAGMSVSTTGHPEGFKYQTFFGRTTQSGFARSLQLPDVGGKKLYKRDFAILPLDLTVYDGMSGGPIVAPNGQVIGVLIASFNIGGSLSWAAPAKALLALNSTVGSAQRPALVKWSSYGDVTDQVRALTFVPSTSAADTVNWINSKLADKALTSLDLNGFPVHVTKLNASYKPSTASLEIASEYNTVGEQYRTTVSVTLADALRSEVAKSGKIAIMCPPERACIESLKEKKRHGEWKAVEKDETTETLLDSVVLVDEDSAERVGKAISHLIQLHGGPVVKREVF